MANFIYIKMCHMTAAKKRKICEALDHMYGNTRWTRLLYSGNLMALLVRRRDGICAASIVSRTTADRYWVRYMHDSNMVCLAGSEFLKAVEGG